MKTQEEALKEWVLGRIRFKIGNRKVWKKDHFTEIVYDIEHNQWGITLSYPVRYKDAKGNVKTSRRIGVVLDSKDPALTRIREWIREGNSLPISFVLRFDSLEEMMAHLKAKAEKCGV